MLADVDAYATIPVSDMDRARQFYGDALGFPVQEEDPGGVLFRSGSSGFYVFTSSGHTSGSATQMGWRVSDIESVVNDLRSRGVTFEEYNSPPIVTENGIATLGPARAAWFKDPEGNLLGIFDPGT